MFIDILNKCINTEKEYLKRVITWKKKRRLDVLPILKDFLGGGGGGGGGGDGEGEQ